MRRIEEVAMRDGQHLEPIPESAAIVASSRRNDTDTSSAARGILPVPHERLSVPR